MDLFVTIFLHGLAHVTMLLSIKGGTTDRYGTFSIGMLGVGVLTAILKNDSFFPLNFTAKILMVIPSGKSLVKWTGT